MYLHGNSRINEKGHLEIGGCDTVELVNKFGTPLFVYDENLIREKSRAYKEAFQKSGFSYQVAYASKAFMSLAMCRVAADEGLSLDVVSGGELYTALKADFPVERIHFHGNNKTIEEMEMALDAGIGCFVVDNFHELEVLHALGQERGKKVNILLRLTPGVSAHTHEYISTGQEDSKFGFSIHTGQALEAIKQALKMEYYNVLGVHSHIGSQIFETVGFVEAVRKLSDFLFHLRGETGYEIKVLNLGGGFGIRYTEEDTPLTADQYILPVTDEVKKQFEIAGYALPEIWIEPGRSIVGDAGTTLYKIGSVKTIPGVRKYVAVDGGMTDNIRPALYQSRYEATLANRAQDEAEEVVSIAGKCCESGDMLIWDINLPVVAPGDLLAVSCTGAYGYAMANNYNRIARPAVVFVKDGQAEVVIARETMDDLVKLDRIPTNMMASK
ncbi:diaminopimelate decarboxylase [Ammoniphilus resinae]|uniref:Diaminopimelate decarboxylase n=1 Tax=Ammoniphilus resinae TaxID=861532 RepID=A0ABS4GTF4_9BACL|nr:diaminopimelate decarboxylase [Ammoniphilus resinae]MBP1933521.1 diaminopimelate decarboxylase [Ammoniphilus resinae]